MTNRVPTNECAVQLSHTNETEWHLKQQSDSFQSSIQNLQHSKLALHFACELALNVSVLCRCKKKEIFKEFRLIT